MGIKFDQVGLIINRLRHSDLTSEMREVNEKIKANYFIGLKDNSDSIQLSESGKDVMHLPEDNPVLQEIEVFLSHAGYY